MIDRWTDRWKEREREFFIVITLKKVDGFALYLDQVFVYLSGSH